VEWLQTPSLATAMLFNSIDNQGALIIKVQYFTGTTVALALSAFLTPLF
jgi:hypothetical protein